MTQTSVNVIVLVIHSDIVDILVQRGADVDTPNKGGRTPVQLAVSGQQGQ